MRRAPRLPSMHWNAPPRPGPPPPPHTHTRARMTPSLFPSFSSQTRKRARAQTLVCGTEADLRTPPPAAAFVPLVQLLPLINEGQHYVPLTRAELLNPLGQRLLGDRTRATPLPMPAGPAAAAQPPPALTPVVVQQATPAAPPPQAAQPQPVMVASQPQPVLVTSQPQPVMVTAQPQPMVVNAAAGVPFPGIPHLMRPMHVLPHMAAAGPMMRPRPVGQYVVPSVVYAQPYNPAAGGVVQQQQYTQQQPLYTGGTVMMTPVVSAPPPPPR